MKSLSMGVAGGVLLMATAGVGFRPCQAAGMLLGPQSAAPAATDADALGKLALQEGEAGKTEEAIRDYQRALEIRPEWKEGRWNLGTLQYEANRYADATATFQKVVEFAPGLGLAWALLGLSEFETKDLDNSLTALEKAESLGIQDDAETERVASYHLGLLLIRSGEFERASALLLTKFGSAAVSQQVKFALGLAMLRVPLLPEQVDPSKESLVLAAGDVAAAGTAAVELFPTFLQRYPEIPYAHYSYGLALAESGRVLEAIAAMREEMKLSPASALPWVETGRLEIRRGNAKAARSAAEKAIELDRENRDAQELLAASLRAADKTEEAARAGTPQQMLAARQRPEQRIVALYAGANPGAGGNDSLLWERAMREFSSGDYSVAANDLRNWVKRNPANGTAWAVLGLSEFALKDYDNALIHLERSQQLGVSGSAESVQSAKYTLGILLVRAGEFERATDVLASAWKSGPLDGKVVYALGLALLRRAELPEQVRTAESALVSSAGQIAVLLQQSEYDAAFARLKPLIEQYPATPFLHYVYGVALLSLSEFDEADAQMRAETEISPSSPLPYLRLASIALRTHRPTEGAAWAGRALKLDPNAAEGHYLLGRAALESGDDSTALRELEMAGRLSPGSPEVHFNLAKAYARAKMPEKAEQERATFSQLNEIAEKERSEHGAQIYTGPHDAGQVMTTAPPQ